MRTCAPIRATTAPMTTIPPATSAEPGQKPKQSSSGPERAPTVGVGRGGNIHGVELGGEQLLHFGPGSGNHCKGD